MKMYEAKDVDAYIDSSAAAAKPVLKEIRKIIKSTIPDVEERISWGIPFYRSHGLLCGYAVYTKHVSFGLCDALEDSLRETLAKKDYITGKKTIQIKFDQKIPTTIIKQIIKAKAKINKTKK